MAELPSATTSISEQSNSAPVSTDLLTIWAAVPQNADGVPRLFSGSTAHIAFHGYMEGAEEGAIHLQDTKKPFLFVGLPIAVAGYIARSESVHTGTSNVTAAVGADGALAEVKAKVTVVRGGTVGTDQIQLQVSLDDGTSYKQARVGAATTYVIPRIGVTISLGHGTLVAGDTVLEFTTVAPAFDSTGIALGLTGLKAKQFQSRSWLFVGDQSTLAGVQAIEAAANAYLTDKKRPIFAKVQLRDRRILESSRVRAALVPATDATLTFAEVGGTGDTITRTAGSFVTDGFQVGDIIRVTGATNSQNNLTGAKIAAITATVITLGADDLVAEVLATGGAITAEPSFVFASTTITRNRGSWTSEGFAIGDHVTVAGSASNNGTAIVTGVSATVLTCAASTFVSETVGSIPCSVTLTESVTAHVAAMDALVASIDSSPRIDIGFGRLKKLSPITGYKMRRPVQWADTTRSYQHDVKTTTWQKDLGTLDGWDIDGEFDEAVDGGALAARFTCARTWENGPNGAFIAQSLTRAGDDSILSMTHNMAVSNVAQAATQRATEMFVGRTLVLKAPDALGRRYAEPRSLAKLKAEVDKALADNVLSNIGGEGQRASQAYWTPATDDNLGVPNATLNGVTTLNLNGTLVHINTSQQVQ